MTEGRKANRASKSTTSFPGSFPWLGGKDPGNEVGKSNPFPSSSRSRSATAVYPRFKPSVSGRSEIKAFEILVLFRLVQHIRVVDESIDCDHLVKLLIFMC